MRIREENNFYFAMLWSAALLLDVLVTRLCISSPMQEGNEVVRTLMLVLGVNLGLAVGLMLHLAFLVGMFSLCKDYHSPLTFQAIAAIMVIGHCLAFLTWSGLPILPWLRALRPAIYLASPLFILEVFYGSRIRKV